MHALVEPRVPRAKPRAREWAEPLRVKPTLGRVAVEDDVDDQRARPRLKAIEGRLVRGGVELFVRELGDISSTFALKKQRANHRTGGP